MNSYERYMAAFRHQQPDCVPLDIDDNAVYRHPSVPPRPKQLERVELVRELGGDPILDLWGPKESYHPDVRVTRGTCGKSDDGCPLRFAEYDTPKGILRQVVKETPDWYDPKEHKLGEWRNLDDSFREDWDVHLFDDWNTTRYVEPLINSMEDIEKLKYLLNIPSGDPLAKWREEAATIKQWAQEQQVLLRGRRLFGGGAAMWLWRWPDYLMALADNPEMVEAFLDVVQDWNTKRAELLLDAGVDVLMYYGYYETTDIYSPGNFDRFCRPFLEKLAGMSHQANCLFLLQRSMGNCRQLDVLKGMPIDILYDVEPGTGGEDMSLLKRELGSDYTLWGGIDSTTVINQGTIEDIDNAIRQAMELLSTGGGYVIRPIAWMENTLPDAASKVEAVIAACRQYGTRKL